MKKNISFSKDLKVASFVKGDKIQHVSHRITSLDSAKFMASSLESLAKNIPKEKLFQTKKAFGEKLDLVAKKGVYPYDWMDSFEKFQETSLPPKKKRIFLNSEWWWNFRRI